VGVNTNPRQKPQFLIYVKDPGRYLVLVVVWTTVQNGGRGVSDDSQWLTGEQLLASGGFR